MNDLFKSFVKSLVLLFSVLSAVSASAQDMQAVADAGKSKTNQWVYNLLGIAHRKTLPEKVITVAVVDDGFRMTHKSFRQYLFTNEKEVPGNYQDDDGNGYTDDIHGWDVSDNDNDASVLRGNEELFYHGTYVSGIITSVFEQFYGSGAAGYLRIIPVKAISDLAKNTYLPGGYKGLKYAVGMNPDIICCAWSGGAIQEEDKALIRQAVQQGIIIVGSAGNFFTEKIEIPASLPGVIAVTAVDSLCRKTEKSSFGMRADVSLPGTGIYGPHPVADNAFTISAGTSPATALAAGCYAALKAMYPKATAAELTDAIRLTCTPIDRLNPTYAGKLGSGIPNMAKAIDFLGDEEFKYHASNPLLPEGKIFYRKNKKTATWDIHPEGAFRGIHIYAASPDYKGNINIFSGDSLKFSNNISQLYKGLYLEGNRFRLELNPRPKPSKDLTFTYYMETIDSTSLYCKDTQFIQAEYGTLTDNSGDENYANNCGCKWQIKVPEGKRILIEFDELDTQPNVDYVWIFDGSTTHPDFLLAKFSGNLPPPIIQSVTNEVLVWFVTDGNTTGKGWKLKFTALGNKE